MGKRLNTEGFIEKVKLVHGNAYDYSLVEYNGWHNKINIICRIHGAFQQEANSHKQGSGCPKCIGRNKTIEEFILEANVVHNNKYDYSLITTTFSKEKAQIICKIHGKFLQRIQNHLRGEGCPKCIGKNKTTEEFIKQVNVIHNNYYDYTKVVYIKNTLPIIIICPKHGEFFQTPAAHLKHGCIKCAGVAKCDTEDFIKKSIEKYGENKFDYTLVNYVDALSKVIFLCKKHNEIFEQTPSGHLNKNGCLSCIKDSRSILKFSTKDFIEKSKEKHGDKYDYSKSDYKGWETKTIIICKKCNLSFEQRCGGHLSGKGCPNCGGSQRSTKEKFIEKANLIHKFNFNYENVIYINDLTKVVIICDQHGVFEQTPSAHLRGQGCPGCNVGYTKQVLANTIKEIIPIVDHLTQQQLYACLQQACQSTHKDKLQQAIFSKNPQKALIELFKENDELNQEIEEVQELKQPTVKDKANIFATAIKYASSDAEALEYMKASTRHQFWNMAYSNEQEAIEFIDLLLKGIEDES